MSGTAPANQLRLSFTGSEDGEAETETCRAAKLLWRTTTRTSGPQGPTLLNRRMRTRLYGGCAGIIRRGVVNERVTQGRRSEPPCPRIMRGQSQGWARSVDRSTCRRKIELRNKWIRSADVVHRDGRPYRGKRQREFPEDSAQSENPSMHGNSTPENRETPATPVTTS